MESDARQIQGAGAAHVNLSRLATENGDIASKFHGWNQAMLQVRNDAAMPRVLVVCHSSFRRTYVQPAPVAVLRSTPTAGSRKMSTADVRMFANSLQAPYCGSNRDFRRRALAAGG